MSALDREVLAERVLAVERHLDMARVHRAAREGPADLLRFLASLRPLV